MPVSDEQKEKIKELLKNPKLSTEEIASLLNVSVGSVRAIKGTYNHGDIRRYIFS